MHAVLMTFEFSGEDRQLTAMFGGFTETLDQARELVTKTWMRDGTTAGGFHVFQTSEAAERFLKSGRVTALASHPDVSDFYVRLFSTLGSVGTVMPAIASAVQTADGVSSEAGSYWQSDGDRIVTHIS